MADWHPILAAVEQEPGLWFLTSQTGVYGVVRLIRIGDERGYRAALSTDPPRIIGYRLTLRSACEITHRAWVRSHGPDPDESQYPKRLMHIASGK